MVVFINFVIIIIIIIIALLLLLLLSLLFFMVFVFEKQSWHKHNIIIDKCRYFFLHKHTFVSPWSSNIIVAQTLGKVGCPVRVSDFFDPLRWWAR